jgi:ribosomal protein L11 methyltransferase
MQEIRFFVAGKDVAAAEELLYALGASAVTLLEAGAVEFYEPLPGEMPLWPESFCCALFEDTDNSELIKMALENQLGQPLKNWQVQAVADTDWQRQLMANFQAQAFGEQQKIWIVPSWCEVPTAAETWLSLDPGIAFGTGEHPTTALCLAWLADHRQAIVGQKVLDYGSGSGILSIAAGKLGASRLYAVDNDPQALAATVKNAEANGLTVHACLPELLTEQGFAVIVANIYSRVLLALAGEFRRLLAPQGLLVLSGIWAHQQEQVASGFATPWQLLAQKEREGWGLLVLQKRLDGNAEPFQSIS